MTTATAQQWTAPVYPIHTRVLYSKDPAFTDSSPGYIVANSGGLVSIAVMIYQPGRGMAPGLREDCYHIDDPRVKLRPAEFWDGGNGVYKLAPIEANYFKAVNGLEEFESLKSRLAAVEKTIDDMLHPNKSKRGGE